MLRTTISAVSRRDSTYLRNKKHNLIALVASFHKNPFNTSFEVKYRNARLTHQIRYCTVELRYTGEVLDSFKCEYNYVPKPESHFAEKLHV